MTLKKEIVQPMHPVLDQRWFNKPVRQHVLEFAQLCGLLLLAMAAIWIYRGRSPERWVSAIVVAGFVVSSGYRAPLLLHPVWKGAMKFAEVMGAVMNVVILSLAWVIMFVPLAITLKICGRRIMDLRYKADVESYWEERNVKCHDFKRLEKQF